MSVFFFFPPKIHPLKVDVDSNHMFMSARPSGLGLDAKFGKTPKKTMH